MVKLYILVALALVGCEACETVANADGKVYDCGTVEYCYLDDSAAELSALTGKVCHEAGLNDRFWPGLTNLFERGCEYDCTGTKGSGCNATGGCWCAAQPASFSGWLHYALLGASGVSLEGCDSSWVKSAVTCRPNRVLDYRGCRWECVSILDLPRKERQ